MRILSIAALIALPILIFSWYFDPRETSFGKLAPAITDTPTYYNLPLLPEVERQQKIEVAKEEAAVTLRTASYAVALTLKPQLPTDTFDKIDRPFTNTAQLLSDKIQYQSANVTTYVERKDASKVNVNFLVEGEPETDVFTYRLTGMENLEAVYRGSPADTPLSPELQGSYDIYHDGKKVFELFRPKFIDSKGTEEWGIIYYNDGTIYINAPEGYFSRTVYPFTVNMTISL